VAWLLFMTINTSHFAKELSRNFVYLVISVTTNDYPWLKCNQTWNTEECRLYPFSNPDPKPTDPTTDPYKFIPYEEPALEFYLSTNAFNATSAFSTLFTWIFALLPLIQGPKSLLRSLLFSLPFALLLNFILFLRAITLQNAGAGVHFLFNPRFSELSHGWVWIHLIRLITGTWFFANHGSLLVVGKYIGDTIFPLPHVFIGSIIAFALLVLNLLKEGGFAGFYGPELLNSSLHKYFRGSNHFNTIPVLLSQLAIPKFWLLVHFASKLAIQLPFLSFCIETLATCWADILPRPLSIRTVFPKSLILTGILGCVGSALSLILLYLQSIGFHVRDAVLFQDVMYLIALFLLFCAIVPLGISKVVNQNSETLLEFVCRLRSVTGTGSSVNKTLFFVCLGLTSVVIFALPVCLPAFMLVGGSPIVVVVIGAVIAILVMAVAFLVHSILHCKNNSKYPCCLPLGRKVRAEPEAVPFEEKFQLDPLVSE